ncbi:hemerythrin domain-containing protein [Halomonas sp. GXIMD04776]|uniref:hemerythrin domain-containing protein n=1 Tax=Halomonas sp. GXIMD04776 TaxID=3415605 RepID=UPI003CA9F816
MSTAILKRLHDDHHHYDGLLCIAERQLHGAQCGDTPDFALLRDIFHYMNHHPDRLHHPFEDRLFERLAERHPDDEASLTILHEQHRRMAIYGRELYETFRAISEGDADPELDLNTLNLAQAYSELYHAHLRCEETRIFPQLAQWLTIEDWQELGGAEDPLTDAEEDKEFQALRERIGTNHTGLWLSEEERAIYCPLCQAS